MEIVWFYIYLLYMCDFFYPYQWKPANSTLATLTAKRKLVDIFIFCEGTAESPED